MGMCKDPRLTYLNDAGYNVVRLPRKGIVPLGVIGRDSNSKSWLGTLDKIWQTNEPVPNPGAPQPVAALTGARTSDIKLSFGLEILANALSGMFGGSAPRLDVAYKDAKYVQFAFKDVRSIGIDPFAINNFLATGDLKPGPWVKRYFTGQKDVEALVITEILEAKSIGVIGKRDAATDVSVELPAIKAVLGAKVGVNFSNASNTEITYDGPEFLAFGYKAFGIGMANGEWQVYGVEAGAGYAFAVDQPALKGVVDEGTLVDIDFSGTEG